MGRKVTTAAGEEMQTGGDRLTALGTFHGRVTKFKYGDVPGWSDPFNGYYVEFEVMEGTEAGKTGNLLMNDPDATHKDKGAFARKRQTALFVATNLMRCDQLGQAVEIEESNGIGAQIVLTLKQGKNKEGEKTEFPELDGTKLYHVDDPRAADCPKNADVLAEIHEAYRHPAEYFKPILPVSYKPKTDGAGGSDKPPKPPASPGGFDETGL